MLGAAFKPDSDDVRDSPALNVAGQIQLQGAAVNVYDPKAMDNSRALFPTLTYSTSALEALRGCRCCARAYGMGGIQGAQAECLGFRCATEEVDRW